MFQEPPDSNTPVEPGEEWTPRAGLHPWMRRESRDPWGGGEPPGLPPALPALTLLLPAPPRSVSEGPERQAAGGALLLPGLHPAEEGPHLEGDGER